MEITGLLKKKKKRKTSVPVIETRSVCSGTSNSNNEVNLTLCY